MYVKGTTPVKLFVPGRKSKEFEGGGTMAQRGETPEVSETSGGQRGGGGGEEKASTTSQSPWKVLDSHLRSWMERERVHRRVWGLLGRQEMLILKKTHPPVPHEAMLRLRATVLREE